MPFQDLSKMGMRPAGSGAGSVLEGILKGAQSFLPAWVDATERKEKREKNKVDMYIDLRKSGYNKDEAHRQVLDTYGGKFEGAEGEFSDLDEEKEKLDVESKKLDIEKKKAEKERGYKKEPSWGQEQEIESIKKGLKRGKIVIGKEFGEPSVYELKSKESALNAIAEAGLDADLFTEELKRYEDVTMKDPKGKIVVLPFHKVEDAKKMGYVEVSKAEEVDEFTEEQEENIKATMSYYGKTREEVIEELRRIGDLPKKGK